MLPSSQHVSHYLHYIPRESLYSNYPPSQPSLNAATPYQRALFLSNQSQPAPQSHTHRTAYPSAYHPGDRQSHLAFQYPLDLSGFAEPYTPAAPQAHPSLSIDSLQSSTTRQLSQPDAHSRIELKSANTSSSSSQDLIKIQSALSLSHRVQVTQWAESRGIEYIFQEGALAAQERDLYISPVEVMSAPGHDKIYGVFSNREILAGERITNYPGEKKRSSQVKKDPSYTYSLPGGQWHIDASKKRGVSAFVNSVIDQELANLEAHSEGDGIEAEIYYVSTRTILRGEQLLICYGDDYKYDRQYLRYLNPQHTHLSSQALWLRNMDAYNTHPTALDREFLALFKRSAYSLERLFVTPLFFEGIEETTVLQENLDLPVLEKAGALSDFEPLNQVEGITTLMGLMWRSSRETVLRFLHKGVDLNRLSNLSGVSALHVLMKSPHFLEEDRVAILKEMKRQKAFFGMRDYQERTPLDYALESRQGWPVIEFLIREFRANASAMQTESHESYVLHTSKSDCSYMSPFEPRGMRGGFFIELLKGYQEGMSSMKLYLDGIFEALLGECEPADWIFLLRDSSYLAALEESPVLKAIFERMLPSLFFPVHMTSKCRLDLLAIHEALIEAIEPKAPVKKKRADMSASVLKNDAVQTWLSRIAMAVSSSDCFDERSYKGSKSADPARVSRAIVFSPKVSTGAKPAIEPMSLRRNKSRKFKA